MIGKEGIKMKQKIILISLLFLAMFMLPASNEFLLDDSIEVDEYLVPNLSEYEMHDPRVIASNEDFETQGWPGNGTEGDPYIISDFNISLYTSAAVYVTNTDAVFILENFNISHSGHDNGAWGIFFENVTNALIRDGNIVGMDHSLVLGDCESVRVTEMYISNRVPGFDDGISNFDLITNSGVMVERGENIEIKNNNIVRVKIGVHLMNSLNAIVTDNTFRYSGVSVTGGNEDPMNYTITGNTVNSKPMVYAYNLTSGVYSGASYGQIILDHCTSIVVEYANLSYVTIGLEINYCYEIRIKDSNMTHNWIGVSARDSEAIELLRCRLEYNNYIGGHTWFATNISIKDSLFAHNRQWGVWLDYGTTYATIFNNVFLNNTINATNDGWYNNNFSYNYWSDYVGYDDNNDGFGDMPYNCCGVLDKYPLMYWPWFEPFPILTGPEDIEYESGEVGCNITWYAFDANPYIYELYKNGILYEMDFWNESFIVIGIDGLPVGQYNYTLLVSDTSGNNATDSVLVIVVDTTPPQLDSPIDFEYEFGITGNFIIWGAFDFNPYIYVLYINGGLSRSGSWDEGVIVIDIDGLLVGRYNYTLLINDTSGNIAIDTVIVTVTEVETSTTTTTTTMVTTDTTLPESTTDEEFERVICLAILGMGAVMAIVLIWYIIKRE